MTVSGMEDFNRFFSYQDEVRNSLIVPYKYAASERAWSDLQANAVKRINAREIDPKNASQTQKTDIDNC